jgi:hypothetical protein
MNRTTGAMWLGLILLCLVSLPMLVLAQGSASAALAAELARQLDARKLNGAAAPLGDGEWVGALYLSGSELLVVKGKYTDVARMQGLVSQRGYREIYITLNSASDPASKVLVLDLGANGLKPKQERNEVPDSVDLEGKSVVFDGDWGRAGLSEAEYSRVFGSADAQYVQMLQALLVEVRKGS